MTQRLDGSQSSSTHEGASAIGVSLDELSYSILYRQLERETVAVREQIGVFTSNCQDLLGLIVVQQQKFQNAPVDSNNQNKRQQVVSSLLKVANDLREESLRIQSNAMQRATDLRESAGSDKSAQVLTESTVSEKPWTTCMRGGSSAAGLLSDIHKGIRSLDEELKTEDEDAVWQAPQTFVRETHKYWVEEERLGEVMLACASEAPLLVYGQKSKFLYGPQEAIDPNEDIWDRVATNITSIYFDSPDLSFYHQRLARSEGSQLFRVRWYGEQPQGDKVLFLELKTHHESWVRDDSTKERVAIQEKHMVDLLKRDAKPWFQDDAETIARAAKPDLSGKQLLESANLLLRIRDLVIKRDLRPCVRTCYSRASFQSSNSNELRLTMDRDVRVYDESSAPVGAWCSQSSNGTTIMKKIPCAIFEVKLAGKTMPGFVQQLTHSGSIADAHKFSKFLTAVSVLHSDAPVLRVLPYWAKEPMFLALYNNHETHLKLGVKNSSSHTVADTTRSSEGSEGCDSSSQPRRRSRHPSSTPAQNLPEQKRVSFTKPKISVSHGNDWVELSSDNAPDIESGTRGRRSWRSSMPFLGRDQLGKKEIALKKRPKIEPKSYFAAERTYIQWISAALLLVTVGSVLNALAVDSTQVTEFTLMVLAALITVYALVIYFRRLYLLERAMSYGYQDHLGPVVLTGAIIAGILTILYFSIAQHRASLLDTSSVERTPGQCIQHEFQGVSMLEFQPSDIVVDTARDIFIIPSITDLVYMPRQATEGEHSTLKTAAIVDSADIEALSFGENGRLYAVSEDPKSSTLLAFDWVEGDVQEGEREVSTLSSDSDSESDDADYKLELIGRWSLKGVANAEGMVVIPGDPVSGKPPRILVSSDAKDLLGSDVQIYGVPSNLTLAESDLYPIHHLNSALLSAGFSAGASTKISAMTYFEGVLYILHDNVRIIRGWDMESGSMVSEWFTPRVGGEFDKQWEGISIERVDGLVVLHMTLDTPPQIWSFFLQEPNTKGSANPELVPLELPPCAQAF